MKRVLGWSIGFLSVAAVLFSAETKSPLAEMRAKAGKGDPEAQYHLGLRYANGDGVMTNYYEAVKWYRLAAEKGQAAAQVALGMMCANGAGTAKKPAEGVKWFRLAAEQGFALGQYMLALAYYNGEGVPKDPVEALAWVYVALANGDEDASQLRATLEKDLDAGQKNMAAKRAYELLDKLKKKA
jgi:TPR repeat protein